MKNLSVFLLILSVAACATPMTTLKHPKTGQVVTCGGGRSGSAAVGLIGYSIEKSQDKDCVIEHQAKGFKVLKSEK